MATIFLDTSALVRRCDRSEPGAVRVRAACAPTRGHTLLLARLASVELASALGRKVRAGTLTVADRTRRWRLFQAHRRDQYQVVPLTEDVYARAERMLFQYTLRAFDAVHVGCALVVATRLPRIGLQFWTADRQQAQTAGSEGLSVQLIA